MNTMNTEANEDGVIATIVSGTTSVTADALGKRRRVLDLSRWEWAFLGVSAANILLCIALSIERLVVTLRNDHQNPDAQQSPDVILTIVLIINSAFCIFYVINGLLKELQYEIYVFACATLFILGYCIIEYIITERRTDIKTVRLVMVCLFGPVNCVLAVKVAHEFGWLEFRILGASQQMQNMFRQAALFMSLLKFDLQAAVSYVILVLRKGTKTDTRVIVVLSVGLPFSVIWALIGRWSMRHESKCGVIVFAVLGLVAPAYIIYSIVYLAEHVKSYSEVLLYSAFIVGGLSLLVRGVLYIELYTVYKNFGKGLRERAFDEVANERTGLLAR